MAMGWWRRRRIFRRLELDCARGCGADCEYRFGFSFLGEKFADAKILGLAYALEQRMCVRSKVKPWIAPSTELCDVV
jgi:hypothetical protein